MKFLPLFFALAATASPLAARSPESETDRLLFSTSLSGFLSARAITSPSYLDWTSDSCSSSPDNPFGYPFDPACQRHDFGYRNYKAQGRFTDSGKLSVDDNFRDDLFAQCAGSTACEATANVYYWAVRAFGRELPPQTDEEMEVARVANPEAVVQYESAVAKAKATQTV